MRPNPRLELREFPRRHWRVTPTTEHPRAEAVLVHGITEHPGRMMATARWLAERDIASRVVELPGHGSGGSGDPARRVVEAYLESLSAEETLDRLDALDDSDSAIATAHGLAQCQRLRRVTVDALATAVERVGAWAKIDGNDAQRPLFIWGHSLGGLASFHAAARLDRDLAAAPSALLLLSAALAAKAPPADGAIGQLLVDFGGLLQRIPGLGDVLRGCAWLSGVSVDGTWSVPAVSDLEAEQRLIAADPLVGPRIPLVLLARIQQGMAHAHAVARHLRTATMVVAAGGDAIVDASGSRRLFDALAASPDPAREHRCLILDDASSHDLPRSSDQDRVLAAIETWLLEGLR